MSPVGGSGDLRRRGGRSGRPSRAGTAGAAPCAGSSPARAASSLRPDRAAPRHRLQHQRRLLVQACRAGVPGRAAGRPGPRRSGRPPRARAAARSPAAPSGCSRSSSWQPTDIAEVTGPGTTIAGRLSASTRLMVCVAPLRAAASTSTVPAVAAAITRLRIRNRCRSGSAPGGHSLISRPVSAIRSNSAALPTGYGRSTPHASTATVTPARRQRAPGAPPRRCRTRRRTPPSSRARPARTRARWRRACRSRWRPGRRPPRPTGPAPRPAPTPPRTQRHSGGRMSRSIRLGASQLERRPASSTAAGHSSSAGTTMRAPSRSRPAQRGLGAAGAGRRPRAGRAPRPAASPSGMSPRSSRSSVAAGAVRPAPSRQHGPVARLGQPGQRHPGGAGRCRIR